MANGQTYFWTLVVYSTLLKTLLASQWVGGGWILLESLAHLNGLRDAVESWESYLDGGINQAKIMP